MDIFQIEARGLFSPPNGAEPQLIPDYWRESPDSEPRTDLPELSDSELNALGWKGPIENPDSNIYDKVWNVETREWDLIELEPYEKERRVNYQKFWNLLIETNAYTKIKTLSKQSLEINTIVTEFIALLSYTNISNPNIAKFQEVLLEIIDNVPFTEEEFIEIQSAFIKSGMYSTYTLNASTP